MLNFNQISKWQEQSLLSMLPFDLKIVLGFASIFQ